MKAFPRFVSKSEPNELDGVIMIAWLAVRIVSRPETETL